MHNKTSLHLPDAPAANGDFRSASHRSVFVKMVAIMVSMAVALLLLVGLFFWYLVGPDLHRSVDVVLESYERDLAKGSVDFATAKDLDARLNLKIRYESATVNWTTDETLPRIDDIQQGRITKKNALLLRRNYYIISQPNGGSYLFAWSLGKRMHDLHNALVVLLFVTMAAIVVITHLVLKRLLAPLRTLNEGVASLSAGQLDIELPNKTRDEFGRLTAAFNTMVGRVRAMIGARHQLLIDVSHELRSPLTRMKVALELLPESEQRAGMAADVAEMERMVTMLLELERLRSGGGLQIARHNLLSLIQESAKPFENTKPGVRIAPATTELPLDLDAEKIKSVFRNLLDNATKYSLPDSRPIEISFTQDTNNILVRVTDDGHGIPESEIERVFEPFYRVDRSRTRTTGGYGLGLSICKRVMQAHGGDITVEQRAGRGATFLLRFAAAPKG